MKFTFSWLKDHLNTSANVNEIVDCLNKIGLEVCSLKTYKTDFKNLKVAKIIDVKKHPNADKLNVCIIKFDETQTQVVCGAPNVYVNKKYVFCLPGSTSAVKDAWNDILFYQLDIRHKPCNFIELIPRLDE